MNQSRRARPEGKDAEPKLRIGVALGGGAAKGLAHIGVLRALTTGGVVPDGIAGTSMGALVGAFYCRDQGLEQAQSAAMELASERLIRTFPLHPHRGGLLSQDRIVDILKGEFSALRFQDLPLPFYCTATHLSVGKRAVFSSGALVPALLASSAIPVVFPPVRHQGRFYVDGGVVDPVPTDVLRENGYDFIIAVNVFHTRGSSAARRNRSAYAGEKGPVWSVVDRMVERMVERHVRRPAGGTGPGVLASFVQTFETMQQALIESQLQRDAPDVVIQVDTRDFDFYEFDRADEIIARGEETGRSMLERVRHGLALRSPAAGARKRKGAPRRD
ncbi:MAG TPA: patatin-like phospholipase family protein [Candidatus Aminicenantes bacterium]|nr:patatin-like phospholipase family protein [Candidatus Aminicenantes bacterium]